MLNAKQLLEYLQALESSGENLEHFSLHTESKDSVGELVNFYRTPLRIVFEYVEN